MALQSLDNLREQPALGSFLFRRVLNLHRTGNRARLPSPADETLRRAERSARRRGMIDR